MKRLNILVVVLTFTLLGCEKYQLKQPTEVSFKIDINRSSAQSGNLVFDSGTIILSNFKVDGERQEGDPISFIKNFPGGKLANFSPSANISELDFDIPQGVYTDLRIRFSIETIEGKSIVVNGTYTNLVGTDIPVVFEFGSSETFEIESEDSSNSGVIVLDKDQPSNALIELDPVFWFDILSINQLENANLTTIDGVSTMLINEESNENLYDLLADRVDESAESVFN